MRIIYLLKKGLQCYPPCLAQVLYLNDIGVDLIVYHGKNSEYVNEILDSRQIEHHTFKSDRSNSSTIQSIQTFLSFSCEINKVLSKIDRNNILWIGNCETAIPISRKLKKYKFVLTVLELYREGSIYDKCLKKILPYANHVICCEKHRATIMKHHYNMPVNPTVIPNKPYHEVRVERFGNDVQDIINRLKDLSSEKKYIIYQGIVHASRPLDCMAEALKYIGDESIEFLVMGQADENYKKKLSAIYPHISFLGYIPAPEHLEITRLANIGIAIYDDSDLNNQFCAPNKIYEYGCFGIPMITSENLGLTETVGYYNAGKCVDMNNVEQLSFAIQEIFEKYDEYSKNARKLYYAVDIRCAIEQIVRKLQLLDGDSTK